MIAWLGFASLLFAILAVLQRDTEPAPPSFAGLGEEAAGYARARRGTALDFPRDHGPHPDFRIEWWYLTANLEDADGTPLGIQWTLFRRALVPPGKTGDFGGSPWTSRQLWMAHAAVSTPEVHLVAERFARDMAFPDRRAQAGVETDPFSAWLDHWRLQSRGSEAGGDALDRLLVAAQGSDGGRDFGYRLQLDAGGPLVLHGEAGFSRKSASGLGSHYYSQPFYRASGWLGIDGEMRRVSGVAWLDREWSSQLLGPDQPGWDWFSLHLDGGAKLMAFRLRGAGEGGGDYIGGSWITRDGGKIALDGDDLQLIPESYSAVAGRRLPTRWRLRLPGENLDVTTTAYSPDRWMDTVFPYWEGNVLVEGSHTGKGYLEMTGY